jgi:hypothetical protein
VVIILSVISQAYVRYESQAERTAGKPQPRVWFGAIVTINMVVPSIEREEPSAGQLCVHSGCHTEAVVSSLRTPSDDSFRTSFSCRPSEYSDDVLYSYLSQERTCNRLPPCDRLKSCGAKGQGCSRWHPRLSAFTPGDKGLSHRALLAIFATNRLFGCGSFAILGCAVCTSHM